MFIVPQKVAGPRTQIFVVTQEGTQKGLCCPPHVQGTPERGCTPSQMLIVPQKEAVPPPGVFGAPQKYLKTPKIPHTLFLEGLEPPQKCFEPPSNASKPPPVVSGDAQKCLEPPPKHLYPFLGASGVFACSLSKSVWIPLKFPAPPFWVTWGTPTPPHTLFVSPPHQ